MFLLILICALAMDYVPYISKFEDFLAPPDIVVLNNTPIVGILTLPGNSELGDDFNNKEIIYGSLVDFLIVGGARVVPISYQSDPSNPILGHINGLIIPDGITAIFGDDGNFTQYAKGVYSIMEFCLYLKRLPILAVGSGFDIVTHILSTQNILKPCPKCKESFSKLGLGKDFTIKLLSYTDPEILYELESKDYMYINSTTMLKLNDLNALNTENLKASTISLIPGSDSEYMVTGLENPVFPLFATKYIPYMGNYLFSKTIGDDKHNSYTIKLSQKIANYFVMQTKQNNNQFASDADANANLIFNYPTTFIPNIGQIYTSK